MNVYSVIKSLFKLSTYSESLNFRVMLFSRHLIFASLHFRDFRGVESKCLKDMLYHDNRPRPGQSLTLKFVAKLSLEVEILAALKFLKIPSYCDCWHGGALFSLAQAHRMRNCYSALLYCTIMFLVCCANIICQRYCCMKTRYGFTAVALKVYDVLACVAVFSVSLQLSGRHAKKYGAYGTGEQQLGAHTSSVWKKKTDKAYYLDVTLTCRIKKAM